VDESDLRRACFIITININVGALNRAT